MNDGFVRVGKPKKERKKCLRDYFVTVEIKYEYVLKATGYKREDAIRNVEEDIRKHQEEGDLWDFLLDEDCSCPNRGEEFKFTAEHLGTHEE